MGGKKHPRTLTLNAEILAFAIASSVASVAYFVYRRRLRSNTALPPYIAAGPIGYTQLSFNNSWLSVCRQHCKGLNLMLISPVEQQITIFRLPLRIYFRGSEPHSVLMFSLAYVVFLSSPLIICLKPYLVEPPQRKIEANIYIYRGMQI